MARCRDLALEWVVGEGYRYAIMYYELNLAFGLAEVTLTFKVLLGLYPRN